MKRGRQYIIPFTGLKDGLHSFTYKIGKPFFDLLEYSEIQDADLDVNFELEKKPNMMVGSFSIKGSVVVTCDRCSDDLSLEIETENELIYKFGEENLEDEKIILLGSNEVEIDISHPIYEFSVLELPSRKVHDEKDCNQEMMKTLDQYLMVEEESSIEENDDDDEDIDPRWSQLKNLK